MKTRFWREHALNAKKKGGVSKERIKALFQEYRPTILVWNRDVSAIIAAERIRELGCKVAVLATHNDIKECSFFIKVADEVINIGDLSYVDIPAIMKLVPEHIIAVLPMWGFVSEIPGMQAECAKRGMIWIGPGDEVLTKLGDKSQARQIAISADVPVSPGSNRPVTTLEEARGVLDSIGYPSRLKAAFGGGGRGQKTIFSDEDLVREFKQLQEYSEKTFGSPDLIIEKEIVSPQHGEVQIIADAYGNVVGADYRICSIQVSGQKKMEFGHHPFIEKHPEIKRALFDNAEKIAKAVSYVGVGTVEFLICQEEDGIKIYFMEVNTRLQVEHGATGILTRLDLVQWMTVVAFGARLDFTRADLPGKDEFSVNLRLVAMDPQNGFQATSGYVLSHQAPAPSANVRVVSALRTGQTWQADYDSMFAMVTVRADSWKELLEKAVETLEHYKIYGFYTSLPFDIKILQHRDIVEGEPVTVDFIANYLDELLNYEDVDEEAVRIARYLLETSVLGYSPVVGLPYRGPSSPYLRASLLPPPKVKTHRSFPDLAEVGTKAYIQHIRQNAADGSPSYEIVIRDASQSEHTNFLSPWLIKQVGPLLQKTDAAFLEVWGGATPQQSVRLMGFPPFELAAVWKQAVPNVPLVFLSRSTNVVSLQPQSPDTIRLAADAIYEHMDGARDFDSVTHTNLGYSREAYLKRYKDRIYMPSLTLTRPNKFFTVRHYVQVAKETLQACADMVGMDIQGITDWVIMDLKDMSGNWKPGEIHELVTALKEEFPELVMRYHTHMNSGFWLPTMVAAVKAGVQIICAGLESMTRNFGPPPILTIDEALRDEGFKPLIHREVIAEINYYLQGHMALYDKYFAPKILGPKYSVRDTYLAGGAQSSLSANLEDMGIPHLQSAVEEYLKRINLILVVHSVTPMQQLYITQAIACVYNSYKGETEEEKIDFIRKEITNMDQIIAGHEKQVSDAAKARFFSPNDTLKKLLMGHWGVPPFGWPADWIYQAVFKDAWKDAIKNRHETPPDVQHLSNGEVAESLVDLGIEVTDENMLTFRLFPRDLSECMGKIRQYGKPFEVLPDFISLQGLPEGEMINFTVGKREHTFKLLGTSATLPDGTKLGEGMLDDIRVMVRVKVKETRHIEHAEEGNACHATYDQPSKIYKFLVKVGDVIEPGQNLVILEIAKVEHFVVYSGEEPATVERLVRDPGEKVDVGDLLVELKKV